MESIPKGLPKSKDKIIKETEISASRFFEISSKLWRMGLIYEINPYGYARSDLWEILLRLAEKFKIEGEE